MTNEFSKYGDLAEKLFKFLIDHEIEKEFAELMRARAMCVARDMIGVNDSNVMFALKGQISVCYELADGVNAALEAKKASANVDTQEGLPRFPEVEL